MKTIIGIIFIAITLILNMPFKSISQTLQWAKGIGGPTEDRISGCTANNDIYIFGSFESSTCYFKTDTFQPRGAADLFIGKYDINGTEKWVRQIGGNGNEENIYDIISDNDQNNIYITGYFTNDLWIDSVHLTSTSQDLFLAKYDSSGNLKWVVTGGSSSIDVGNKLAIDSSDNIYLSSIFYGPGSIGGINVNEGCILSKFDTNGNSIWAKKVGKNIGLEIKICHNEVVFSGTTFANVDTSWIDTLTIPLFGFSDILFGKFDTSGKLIWINHEGWTSNEYNSGLTIDDQCNFYFAGNFTDSTIIHTDTLRNLDAFIAKYNNSGTFQWVKEFGTKNTASFSSLCYSIASDSQNNLYVVGISDDTLRFDNFNLIGQGFIARYSTNGICIGANSITGKCRSVSIASNNKPIICGYYGYMISTASGDIQSYGQDDGFVAMHDVITGMDEVERKKQNELLIYSNPTSGKCNVTIPDEWSTGNQELNLNLYDERGLMLHSYLLSIQDGIIKLDLENEAKGIYIVTLSDGKKVFKGKIIFE